MVTQALDVTHAIDPHALEQGLLLLISQ